MNSVPGMTFADVVAASQGVPGVQIDFVLELAKSSNQLVSWYACKAIGALRIDQGIPVLLQILAEPAELLGDNDTDRRLISAWSLGKFDFSLVGTSLTDALKSENELLRQGAADALGELGDKRAVPELLQLVQLDTFEVAQWAALSLAKIGEPSRQPLESALYSEQNQIRRVLLQDALEKLDAKIDETHRSS